VAAKVHHVEGVEPAVSLDIPGTHHVCLMDVVHLQRFDNVWILDPFGNISSFF
jgi:hypothetical protein